MSFTLPRCPSVLDGAQGGPPCSSAPWFCIAVQACIPSKWPGPALGSLAAGGLAFPVAEDGWVCTRTCLYVIELVVADGSWDQLGQKTRTVVLLGPMRSLVGDLFPKVSGDHFYFQSAMKTVPSSGRQCQDDTF